MIRLTSWRLSSEEGLTGDRSERLSLPAKKTHTTQQNLDIMATVGEVLLNLVLGNETGTASPIGRWVVEHIEDGEPGRMGRCQLIQFGLEQDVRWIDVGVDETNFSLIRGIFESSTDNLEHGGDTRSSSDHSELTRQIGGIDEFTLGAFDPELVTNPEEGHVAGDVSFLVGLEMIQHNVERVKVTRTFISRSK